MSSVGLRRRYSLAKHVMGRGATRTLSRKRRQYRTGWVTLNGAASAVLQACALALYSRNPTEAHNTMQATLARIAGILFGCLP